MRLWRSSPFARKSALSRRLDIGRTSVLRMLAQKKADLSALRTRTGNSRSIDRLQRSAPEMVSKAKMVATPLASIQVERSSGVTSQASVLFQLMATRQSIADWIVESGTLHATRLAARSLIRVAAAVSPIGSAL